MAVVEVSCQYGAGGPGGTGRCGTPASTAREWPGGREGIWAVCEFHAITLDRLRANIAKHHDLLERLRESWESFDA